MKWNCQEIRYLNVIAYIITHHFCASNIFLSAIFCTHFPCSHQIESNLIIIKKKKTSPPYPLSPPHVGKVQYYTAPRYGFGFGSGTNTIFADVIDYWLFLLCVCFFCLTVCVFVFVCSILFVAQRSNLRRHVKECKHISDYVKEVSLEILGFLAIPLR